MSGVLNGIEPKEVFNYFEEISQIPRGSGNERGISNYLVDFAKKHNLEVIQDKAMNVIIRKPATPGYENAPGVILQGHMDMVCEKNKDTKHDFEKDPIKLRVVEDMLYATGTTLGADNGIAVAYGLAILAANDIAHPALELLVTVEEETGMGGAIALDAKNIKGTYLINIDSEEEGKLLVSCAGGMRTKNVITIAWEDAKAGMEAYTVGIRGLKGGHSGMEIHKGRGNSNKLMGRILNSFDFDFDIASINGGAKMNAIPREADAVVLINPADAAKLQAKVAEWNNIFKNELRASDPEVQAISEKAEKSPAKVFSKDTARNAIATLVLIPNGIQSMSMDIKDLVESSTNLGVVTTFDNEIIYESCIRSSVGTLKYNTFYQVKMVADMFGQKLLIDSEYPAWEYNPNSKIRELFIEVYKNKYGKEPEIVALHAGVECGLLGEKKTDLDMVSFGPNTFDVHTPDEHVSISSTNRMWEYLLEVLKNIK